jgi:hypothetical protein
LIDLTIDGRALSNSKAAIPGYSNRAIMRLEGEILYEGGLLQQNTVNDGLPARLAGLPAMPGAGHATYGASGTGACVFPRQLSALPNPRN